MSGWPSVGVVVPTHDRPVQVREALPPSSRRTTLASSRPSWSSTRPCRPDLADLDRAACVANDRKPGLAGARNCGILALDTDLVAFCDDDDQWLPGKLRPGLGAARQAGSRVRQLRHRRRFDCTSPPRLAGRRCHAPRPAAVPDGHGALVHLPGQPGALLDGIGLLDEDIPGSQNEDWDLALRAARRHPIVNVDQPLVRVAWGASHTTPGSGRPRPRACCGCSSAIPCRSRSGRGGARVRAGRVRLRLPGQASRVFRWAWRALRRNWHERRVPFAVAVAAGPVPGERVLRELNARGHGI